jgi:hypothetical protein
MLKNERGRIANETKTDRIAKRKAVRRASIDEWKRQTRVIEERRTARRESIAQLQLQQQAKERNHAIVDYEILLQSLHDELAYQTIELQRSRDALTEWQSIDAQMSPIPLPSTSTALSSTSPNAGARTLLSRPPAKPLSLQLPVNDDGNISLSIDVRPDELAKRIDIIQSRINQLNDAIASAATTSSTLPPNHCVVCTLDCDPSGHVQVHLNLHQENNTRSIDGHNEEGGSDADDELLPPPPVFNDSDEGEEDEGDNNDNATHDNDTETDHPDRQTNGGGRIIDAPPTVPASLNGMAQSNSHRQSKHNLIHNESSHISPETQPPPSSLLSDAPSSRTLSSVTTPSVGSGSVPPTSSQPRSRYGRRWRHYHYDEHNQPHYPPNHQHYSNRVTQASLSVVPSLMSHVKIVSSRSVLQDAASTISVVIPPHRLDYHHRHRDISNGTIPSSSNSNEVSVRSQRQARQIALRQRQQNERIRRSKREAIEMSWFANYQRTLQRRHQLYEDLKEAKMLHSPMYVYLSFRLHYTASPDFI